MVFVDISTTKEEMSSHFCLKICSECENYFSVTACSTSRGENVTLLPTVLYAAFHARLEGNRNHNETQFSSTETNNTL